MLLKQVFDQVQCVYNGGVRSVSTMYNSIACHRQEKHGKEFATITLVDREAIEDLLHRPERIEILHCR